MEFIPTIEDDEDVYEREEGSENDSEEEVTT